MLKRLGLDKGVKKKKKKKKKKKANVSLLMEGNRIVGAFQIREQKSPILQAIFMQQLKEIILPNYPLVFLYLNIEMCGYFGTKNNDFTKLSFSFVST